MADYSVYDKADILEIDDAGSEVHFNSMGTLRNESPTVKVYYVFDETTVAADVTREVNKGVIMGNETIAITPTNDSNPDIYFKCASGETTNLFFSRN